MQKFLVLCLLSLLSPMIAAESRIRPAADPIPNEYIVMLRETPSERTIEEAHALSYAHGGTVLGVMKHGVQGFGFRGSRQAAEALARNPKVFQVEENGRGFISAVQEFPDDTWWHLDRIDNRGPLYSYRAYAYTTTADPVNVYVLGTGVLASHEQFDGRVQSGKTYGDLLPANNPCGQFGDWYGPGHEQR